MKLATLSKETEVDVFEGVDMPALRLLADFMRDSLTWRVLILPQQPKVRSKGGIELPDSVQDSEQHLQYIGMVLAIGPLAGKNERFLPPSFRDINLAQTRDLPFAWPYKVGDWVTYGRYAGMKQEYRGTKLLVVNDDELTGRIPGPEGFKIYA